MVKIFENLKKYSICYSKKKERIVKQALSTSLFVHIKLSTSEKANTITLGVKALINVDFFVRNVNCSFSVNRIA